MLRTLFATTAITALLAVGAQAQQEPTDAETTPPRLSNEMAENSPMVEGTEAEATQAADPAAPATDLADDPAMAPAESVAEDPAAPPPADDATVAEDPLAPSGEGTLAQDPAVPADETIAADPAVPAAPEGVALEEGWSEVDVASVSTDSLIGSDIQTYDQEKIASIQDVVVNPQGQVEGIVARFGGFLGFGETTVMLDMSEVTVIRDADDRLFVLTNLTPEALEERPVYEVEPAG